jgi:hypothetical protein
MQSFTIAKIMLTVVAFIGWIVIVIAVIVFFLPFVQVALTTKISGLSVCIFLGLLLVAMAQMGLAQIATAENTKRMIELLEALHKRMYQQDRTVVSFAPKIEPVPTRPR